MQNLARALQPRRVVAFCLDHLHDELVEMVDQLEVELDLVAGGDFDPNALLSQERPLALLCDCSNPLGRELVLRTRESAVGSDLPILAVVNEPWGHLPGHAISLGVDDYIPIAGLGELNSVLRALGEESAPVGPTYSGKIVLADSNRDRRIALGRQLRRMGLEVQFALDAEVPMDQRVKLVVTHASLYGALEPSVKAAAPEGAQVPCVVVGTAAELEELGPRLSGQDHIACFDIESDACQIAFVVNGLFSRGMRSLRRSVRYAYETPVRWQTEHAERWGYSYNVSREGIYVRTLTPPVSGTKVTLELRPPFGRGRVVIDGTAVWRQPSARGGQPPGFGVQYADEQAVTDAAALAAGYGRLAEEQESKGRFRDLPSPEASQPTTRGWVA